MRRREFLGVLGAATVPSLFDPESNTLARDIGGVSVTPTVEVIHSGAQNNHKDHIQAFKDALALGGYSSGGGVTINEHYVNDKTGDLDTIAENIVNGGAVDLLVAAGGSRSADAAYKATDKYNKSLPVVFTSVADPTRRANNMTGICAQTTKLDAKRLKYLSQLLPGKTDFGVILNKERLDYQTQRNGLDNEASILGLTLHYQDIVPSFASTTSNSVASQVDTAFQIIQNGIQNYGWGGAVVGADPVFNNHRSGVIPSANNRKVPTIYQWREFAEENGLIAYGPNLTAAYALAGDYVARILDQLPNPDPTKLPILSLENFELVVNLKTAKTVLNLRVPPVLLAQADRIIVK
jgi:putative ABC transport system substrate-binding protein